MTVTSLDLTQSEKIARLETKLELLTRLIYGLLVLNLGQLGVTFI